MLGLELKEPQKQWIYIRFCGSKSIWVSNVYCAVQFLYNCRTMLSNSPIVSTISSSVK